MAKFVLDKNEEVLTNYQNVLVYANDYEYHLDLFVTNKRLVLLTDANKELDYINIFRNRGHFFPEELEIAFETSLDDIKEIAYIDGEYNHVTFKDNSDSLDIYVEDLKEYIK